MGLEMLVLWKILNKINAMKDIAKLEDSSVNNNKKMKTLHRKNAANLMTIGLSLTNKRQSEVVPGWG